MDTKNFFIKLFLTTAIAGLIYFLLTLVLNIAAYSDLFLVSVAFFICYNIALYYLSRQSKESKVKNQFIHLVLYNVFIKIILSFVVVFIYFKITEPQDKYFIAPFVLCYFVYSAFETLFMSRMAKVT